MRYGDGNRLFARDFADSRNSGHAFAGARHSAGVTVGKEEKLVELSKSDIDHIHKEFTKLCNEIFAIGK